MKTLLLSTLLFFSYLQLASAQAPKVSVTKQPQTPDPKKKTRDTVFIKQLPGEHFQFEQSGSSIGLSGWVSIIALAVSIFSVYLSILKSNKADKRSLVFKMYDVWNSDEIRSNLPLPCGVQVFLKHFYKKLTCGFARTINRKTRFMVYDC